MSRRPTILGLAETAADLLTEWRDEAPPPGVGGDTREVVRRLVDHAERAVARAERESASAHADGVHREADVARRLGVADATLRRWRASQRARRADRA